MFHYITRGGSKGKGRGVRPPTLFWVKVKKNRRRKAGKASDMQPGPPPLAQGLDPVLITTMVNLFSTKF